LVATSHVYFTSGYIQDVQAICEIAHRRGALAFVDDYQATGQVPVDVRETEADILVSGGLKWLLGGPGITYMYVRKELIPDLEPTVAGWFGNRDQFLFDPHAMVFRDTASRFETGTPSMAAVYTGAEGLRMVNELGPEAIRQRTSDLTSQLVALLRERGFRLRAPKDAAQHASITMIEIDDPGAVVESLARQDIIVDFRPGAVRVSPYFYNTSDDIGSLVEALCHVRDGSR
jgi:selenocysteine lyase/cysteine desulfurase